MNWLMAAGGTGGTVIPAIVVANEVKKRHKEAEILFVGTERGFEKTLVPQAGYPLELINIGGLKRMKIFSRLTNFLRLPRSFFQSWKLLRRFRPHYVFGSGGYASGPILLLAALMGIRTGIVEPNAVPGFANRVLARFVDRVFLAFEEAAAWMPKRKSVVSGNPIRKEILDVSPPSFSNAKRTVLIFGGSQGALRLNEGIAGALPRLLGMKEKISFIHQTGAKDLERIQKIYADLGFHAEIRTYFDDMAGAYAAADLIVARSGSSVLEIAAVGRPSILVPFPYATDDHQQVNAEILSRTGAAITTNDEGFTGERVASILNDILFDDVKLKAMSRAALSLRKANAAATIVDEMERIG